MKVELRKVKIAKFLSEETTAFNADLWVDGEQIGTVSNNGQGGSNNIHHLYNDNGLNTRNKVQAFEKWCEEQPDYDSPYGSLGMSADFYISLMVQDYEEAQQLKRWCKTKTVIRLKGAPEGEYQTYKKAYDADFAKVVRINNPDLAEIINERFI
jgi:hypothetical protein